MYTNNLKAIDKFIMDFTIFAENTFAGIDLEESYIVLPKGKLNLNFNKSIFRIEEDGPILFSSEIINDNFKESTSAVTDYFNHYNHSADPKLGVIKTHLWNLKNLQVEYKSALDLVKGYMYNRKGYEYTSFGFLMTTFYRNYESLMQQIETIIEQIEFNYQNESINNLPSVIPDNRIVKVMLMYELGIFDYLKERYEDMNPTRLSQVIESFTGIEQSTIRQYYREIIGERQISKPHFDEPKKMSVLNEILLKLKLVKKGNP